MKSKLFLTILLIGIFYLKGFSQTDTIKTEDLLSMSFEDLLNMDITTASKSSEKLFDAPGVISVITKDELNRFGGTTLKEILERVPSLIGSTVYMTDRSTVAPRGDQVQPSSSHVLLLINGRPVREVLEGGIKSEMYESFPVNIIEKIEVIRGPGSVLYGSNAFSAVINVITENVEGTEFEVSGLAGISGSYGLMGKAKINIGDVNIVAAGRYFQKPEWETNWQYTIPPAGDTTVGITVPDKGPGAYFEVNYKNLRFISSFNQWETHYAVADYAFIFPAYGVAKWKKGFGDLGYKLKVSDKWDMDFNATYSRSTFSVSSWPASNRDSYELIGEWANFWNPTDKIKVIFGGLYNYNSGIEYTKGITENDTVTDASRNGFAGYSQVEYSASDWLKLIGGLQINKVEGLDIDLNPRVGIILYPVQNLNFKALYSQAFRAPSINELEIDFAQMMGNPNLKPEKIKTIDIGINYSKDNIQAGLNYFNSKMTNIIYQDRSGAVPQYNNIGEVDIWGIEFETKYYLNRKFFLTGSLLYQESKDKQDNENVTPIANTGLKGGISYMDKGLTVSLFDIYQADVDEKYHTVLNPSPGDYNLVNFHLKYDMNNLINIDFIKELSLFMQIDNLMDQEIWLPNWGLAPGNSMPYNRGREIYFGLTARF
ncbi:MAG: TonB-dependent receptor [Bacteroidales bacterium]|nr:TonB-dependent receptor [Bacteroidales bacterium]